MQGLRLAMLMAAMLPALTDCTTVRLTEPGQTATEQLLISTAVDRAVEQFDLKIPAGTSVYVDAEYFDSAPGDVALYSKYAVASIRDHLLRQGARLTEDRKAADLVAELRTGGQSIDHRDFMIGLPAIPIPIPVTGTVTTPKIAIYESDRQTGIAKLAVTAIRKNGALAGSTGPVYGASRLASWDALLFLFWNKQDIKPDGLP